MENLKYMWLTWANEIQALAQSGLAYTENIYDIERYTRLRALAAEIIAQYMDMPIQDVQAVYCNEVGYQTPKLDSRAVVFKEDKILLVQEHSGLWCLPGGWVDADQTIKSNTLKEAKEEAGATVTANRIIAVHDRNLRNAHLCIHNIVKVFVLCDLIDLTFKPNSETMDSCFFSIEHLPNLCEEKTTYQQLKMCFEAKSNAYWQVEFD